MWRLAIFVSILFGMKSIAGRSSIYFNIMESITYGRSVRIKSERTESIEGEMNVNEIQ